jgi:hypothetical protein
MCWVFLFSKIDNKVNFFIRICRKGVYLKSVSRTIRPYWRIVRGKEGLVDSAPCGIDL